MDNIRRNTDPMKGPPDGVAMDIKCAVTQYERALEKDSAKKGRQRAIKAHGVMPCTAYCSFQDGTVGVSIRELDLQFDIRADELTRLMQASAELAAPMREQYPDADIEAKWRELQNVPMVEGDSPSGLILAAPWWIFPRGMDKDDLLAWFGGQHSLGIERLLEMTDPAGQEG